MTAILILPAVSNVWRWEQMREKRSDTHGHNISSYANMRKERSCQGGESLGKIERSIVIDAPVEEVFGFVNDFDNFIRTSSPDTEMEILSRDEGPQRVGFTLKARTKVGGQVWEVEVETTEFVENKRYAARQKGGPLKKFNMLDTFEPSNGGTRWTSILEYELPYSLLGRLIDRLKVRKAIEKGADYHIQKTKELIEKG